MTRVALQFPAGLVIFWPFPLTLILNKVSEAPGFWISNRGGCHANAKNSKGPASKMSRAPY